MVNKTNSYHISHISYIFVNPTNLVFAVCTIPSANYFVQSTSAQIMDRPDGIGIHVDDVIHNPGF